VAGQQKCGQTDYEYLRLSQAGIGNGAEEKLMEISIREIGDVSILDFSGNFDTNTSPLAESDINKLLDAGCEKILFNFSELNYISSSGLRVLLATAKKLKVSGGAMQLCNLNEVVQEVFDISGFATILKLASDETEALAAF